MTAAQIAARYVAQFDAAVAAENLDAMQFVVDAVCALTDRKLRAAILNQIEG